MGKFFEKKKQQALAYATKQLNEYAGNKLFPACYCVFKKHCKEDVPSYETFLNEVKNEIGGLN